jgi:DUF4097 and DUF4098 domain-containing protein YvlB
VRINLNTKRSVIELKTFAKFGMLIALSWLPCMAQQTRVYQEGSAWVEEMTGSLPGARILRIDTQIGEVHVRGGNQQNVTYVIRKKTYASSEQSARRQFEAYKVTIANRGDTNSIEAESEASRFRKFNADFTVTVPGNLEFAKLETQGGNVSADNISGRVDASSGGGNLKLDNIGGNVRGETGGGTIDVGSSGGQLDLETGGGSIHVDSAKGKIQAQTGGGSVEIVNGLQGAIIETGGGSIHVRQCQGKVKASTGGGGIDLGDVGGPAELETGGGSIRLAGAKGPVRAETGGGSIELYKLLQGAYAETGGGAITAQFVGSRGSFSESMLDSSAGDITVYLAPDLNISVRASIDVANGHNIRSDFPDLRIISEGGEYGPKHISAEGNLNGGGPVLKVHTTTGDIAFLRTNR